MIIWTGWGILVPLLATLGIGGLAVFSEEVLSPDATPYAAAVGALVAAVAIFFIGRSLNKPVQGYHPRTGEPVTRRNRHTFFFVPMQHWALILPAAGLVVTVVTTLNGTA